MTTQPELRLKPSAGREVSPGILALFQLYLHWYIPRHFHAVRIAHAGRFPRHDHPLLVCINHASWWDPLAVLLLGRHLAPQRTAYAPFEAKALAQYGFFRKLGAFPVDNNSPRAGAQFLRQAAQILERPSAMLWITPEGRFTDVRRRPVTWKAGAATLTRHIGDCTVVPLAIEYTFWDERLPEMLCLVGEPLSFSSAQTESAEDRNHRLESAMTLAQDELATRAMTRNPALFDPVLVGSAGVSATYDFWRRLKAAAQGKPYIPGHSMIAPK